MASDYGNPAQSEGYDYNSGADIFGSDGQRIGTLSDKGVQNGYLVVHHGALLGKDAYVPLSRVVDTRQDGIYLDVGKDQLADFDNNGAPNEAPQNVGSAGGGDTWTYMGEGSPQASGQPITQPAPLRMRAPQRTGAGLGSNMESNARMGQNAQNLNTDTVDRGDNTNQGSEQIRVPLAEEELVAGKREKAGGQIGLHKDVIEEEKSINVPVTHDEVQIEHRPIAGGAVQADQIGQDVFQERDINVPVRDEEVVTGKRAQATDEVVINKTPVTENQEVTGTVRRERLHVDGENVDTVGNDEHLADNLSEDQRANTTQP